jgi:hypothetical protein
VLYPFRFRDPVTGKWVRARYKAERTEIATRYAEWELRDGLEQRISAAIVLGIGGLPKWRVADGRDPCRLLWASNLREG